MKADYTLYLVTDRRAMSAETLEAAVEQALLGGCTMVQLRETGADERTFYDSACAVKKITDCYGVPLIINNSVAIALAAGAAGVHIGQRDLPAETARRLIGPDMLLGVSASSVQEARRAQADGADYIGVGAVFPTNTKKDAPRVSWDCLEEIRRAVRIPIVAIGGISMDNIAQFAGRGISGAAVVSAVIAQPDIRRAAAALREEMAKVLLL